MPSQCRGSKRGAGVTEDWGDLSGHARGPAGVFLRIAGKTKSPFAPRKQHAWQRERPANTAVNLPAILNLCWPRVFYSQLWKTARPHSAGHRDVESPGPILLSCVNCLRPGQRRDNIRTGSAPGFPSLSRHRATALHILAFRLHVLRVTVRTIRCGKRSGLARRFAVVDGGLAIP
jgi:hypothetical protein